LNFVLLYQLENGVLFLYVFKSVSRRCVWLLCWSQVELLFDIPYLTYSEKHTFYVPLASNSFVSHYVRVRFVFESNFYITLL